MSYVDGFLIPISKKNLKAYFTMAKKAGKIWREYGALDYKECIADDLKAKGMTSLSKSADSKAGETVIFSYIVYRSRAHRDSVNKKIMKDPRISEMCKGKEMPFDVKRMAYGGFKVMVDLPKKQ